MRRLVIVDGPGLVCRVWYGHAPDKTVALERRLAQLAGGVDQLLVAWDVDHTWRHDLFPDYKGTRGPRPGGLELFRKEALRALCRARLAVWAANHEADDVMAHLALAEAARGGSASIRTDDKDLAQLVGLRGVWVRNFTGELADALMVHDRWGVKPAQLPELFGLAGDSADNIPGVPGVGVKRGAALITQHGTLERLYQEIDSCPAGIRTALERHRESAFLSRELATLRTAGLRVVPVPLSTA